MTSHPIDTLIIGQGFAGTLLARALLRRGREVVVVDDGHRHSSSRAAAGLINPLAGRQLALNPRVGRWLATAGEVYASLEAELGRRLLFSRPMVRLAPSEKVSSRWQRRIAEDPGYAPYVDSAFAPGQSGLPLVDPAGGVFQTHTGYIAPEVLLEGMRAKLAEAGRLQEQQFRSAELEFTPDGVQWRHLAAKRIIFCEGRCAAANPWFDWLPLRPVKGEILTLSGDFPLQGRIVNAGKWLLPLEDGRVKMGATYDHSRVDEEPTDAAQEMLLSHLGALLKTPPPVEVVEHRAGVRPGTADRKPFVGLHPRDGRLGIFNGFGSKGSLMIPWYAEQFAEHLLDGVPLPAEADIARYPCGPA